MYTYIYIYIYIYTHTYTYTLPRSRELRPWCGAHCDGFVEPSAGLNSLLML